MNTQNIIGYKKWNKIDIIQFIVPFIMIFITIFISNILRQNRVENITYQHKQQIKYIKYWLCGDLRNKVWLLKKNRSEIVQIIEDRKVILIKSENHNKYFSKQLPTEYLKENINKLEMDIEDIKKRSIQIREEIARCDTRPERQFLILLWNM